MDVESWFGLEEPGEDKLPLKAVGTAVSILTLHLGQDQMWGVF